MTLEAIFCRVSLIFNKISSLKIKRQSTKAVCDLIKWMYRREPFKRLFTLAFVKAGIAIQKYFISIMESASPRKDEDVKDIARLQWTLHLLEKVEQGGLTVDEFKRIYEGDEDDDDALDAEVHLNDRLEELGAFEISLPRQILIGLRIKESMVRNLPTGT